MHISLMQNSKSNFKKARIVTLLNQYKIQYKITHNIKLLSNITYRIHIEIRNK